MQHVLNMWQEREIADKEGRIVKLCKYLWKRAIVQNLSLKVYKNKVKPAVFVPTFQQNLQVLILSDIYSELK